MQEMDPGWDAFRSQKRAAGYTAPYAPWMVTALQTVKLAIFILLHALLVVGTACSKAVVILLATNFDGPPAHAVGTEFTKKCPVDATRTEKQHAAIYLTLLFIQIDPDLCAIIQSIFRLITQGRGTGGLNITVIILECCRAAGLSTMFFLVFPKLDMTRALLLLSCLPLIPVAQRMVAKMSRSLRRDSTLVRRMGLTLMSLPTCIVFLTLLTGCYWWSILETPFDNYVTLPLAIVLSSLGFWEAWITTGHAGTFFHHLYQLKYGIRKLNSPTRLIASSLRTIITLSVFAVAAQLRMCARLLAGLELRTLPIFHPLFLTAPLLLTTIVITCHISPDCSFARTLASYGLSIRCSQWSSDPKPFSDLYIAVIWLIISMYKAYELASQPTFEKQDEIIRSSPAFLNGLCVEQSLLVFEFALARDESKQMKLDFDAIFDESSERPSSMRYEADKMANVYICATMWHETDNEMRQMFSSILKLDEEQAQLAAKKAGTTAGGDAQKFRLEAHIFFDDAWEDQPEFGRAPNDFFRTFFQLMNTMIHGKEDATNGDPTKILVSTAYGGRLVVRLPAGTLLFVHLKDKKLIRHKKRWSQVMYMYYLLGHRIMESHMSIEDKQLIAENTYILAIDGDSKFEPEAFLRLLNLMSAKSDIGCACGRIHPIGRGIMVAYQKFEYAIAHWFQKAAEHVFGCVLCAPGCFSLFRASALMDDNVMHKYTTTAVEPRHFVQYDQGEDRWLSTLLLKQGYRIEYAAASDAETYAPEGFDEFFNQRRRWTPSSVANTIDLLADYKRACANNACISRLYILYQFGVIGFSMLGPAIIFSMLVYAQVAAFHVPMDRIMLYNAVPIGGFIASCFLMESSVQLFLAKILSVCYAFVMLAVIVATSSQIVLETMFSPTSMFVVGMIGIFFVAACLHPREFTNILYGTIFFLMIPSTYVVLSFYSLINLNVINWGTREAVAKATGKEVKKASAVDKFFDKLAGGPLGRLFKRDGPEESKRMEELEKRLEEIHVALNKEPNGNNEGESTKPESELKDLSLSDSEDSDDGSDMEVRTSTRDLWMDAEYLQTCEKGRLKASEQQFWDQLIDTYLKPLQTTAAETLAHADALRELRNHIAFSLILLNALMVLAIYLTQSHKDVLAFSWMPHENFTQYRWNGTVQEWTMEPVPLKVELLGLTIIFALFGILVVQTIGLFFHRLNTMVGAFQEIKAMGDFVSTTTGKKADDDDVLEAARSLLATSDYWRAHGGAGYTREAGAGRDAVLHKLQRARFASAVRNHDTQRKA
ncbi:unnamed protein product, partial [Mesorhabditis spiculigera]